MEQGNKRDLFQIFKENTINNKIVNLIGIFDNEKTAEQPENRGNKELDDSVQKSLESLETISIKNIDMNVSDKFMSRVISVSNTGTPEKLIANQSPITTKVSTMIKQTRERNIEELCELTHDEPELDGLENIPMYLFVFKRKKQKV